MPFYPSVLPKSWGDVYVTDNNGMIFFNTGRHRGYVVHVTRGPENDPRNKDIEFPRNGEAYDKLDTPESNGSITIIPRDHPIILRVARRGRPVPLIKKEVEAKVEACGGKPLFINVLSGKASVDDSGRASLGVSLGCGNPPSRASTDPSYRTSYWRISSVTVMAPKEGGVQAVEDSFRIWAPAKGYKESYTFPGSDLHEKNSCDLYFRLLDGKVFGYLSFNVIPGNAGHDRDFNRGYVFILARYAANPAASRNLFSTYGQNIDLPITLQDLDKLSSLPHEKQGKENRGR